VENVKCDFIYAKKKKKNQIYLSGYHIVADVNSFCTSYFLLCRIDNLETTKRGLNGLTFDNPNNPLTKNKNIILTATIIQIINGFYIHKTQI
jgi:hypothetical protein